MLPDTITIAATLSEADRAAIADAVFAKVRELLESAGTAELLRPMTQSEAATCLGVGKSTLSLWTNDDEDPVPAVYIGEVPRYRIVDLSRWIEARTERRRAA